MRPACKSLPIYFALSKKIQEINFEQTPLRAYIFY